MEIELGFPRSWTEFTDPADADQVIRADLTWLTSRWQCIFGRGCPGIVGEPDHGCCSFGAHFTDDDDIARVEAAVERLTPQTWQHHGSEWLVHEPEDESDLCTDVVGGACIFLNGADFDGPKGCALHALADRENVSFVTTKPDVCWQLPIRRSYRHVERADGTEYLEISIAEYTRADWGPGGHDFDWYCTSNTEGHTAPEPLWITNRDELVELLGEPAYDLLDQLCHDHLAGRGSPHPADPIS